MPIKKITALKTTQNLRQNVTQSSMPHRAAAASSTAQAAKSAPVVKNDTKLPAVPQQSLFAEPKSSARKISRKAVAKSEDAAKSHPAASVASTAKVKPKAKAATEPRKEPPKPAPTKTTEKTSAKTAVKLQKKSATTNPVVAEAAPSAPQKALKATNVTGDGVATVKATRKRVPADFATQYGENTERKPRKKVEEVTKRRPRRDAALREKMRDVIEPGDELVARLRRAGMIAGAGPEDDVKPVRRAKAPVRRSHSWDVRCGKCGGKNTFLTQAGLCPRCGAIMVREAV